MEPFFAGGALRRALENLRIGIEARPCVFAHRHAEAVAYGELPPHQKATCRRKIEVVSSPYDLIFAYAGQLLEVFGRRGLIPVPYIRPVKDTPLPVFPCSRPARP